MTLVDRLDAALAVSGRKPSQLARAVGVTRQSYDGMRKRENPNMTAAHAARAAKFLGCDLHWLCTGEGEMQSRAEPSRDARDLLRMFEALPMAEQEKAFHAVSRLCLGNRSALAKLTQTGARKETPGSVICTTENTMTGKHHGAT